MVVSLLGSVQHPVSEGGLTGNGLFTGCFKACVGLYIAGGIVPNRIF